MYGHDPTNIIDWNSIQVELKGALLEEQLHILDMLVMLLNRYISQLKFQWKHFRVEDAALELEDDFQEVYSYLF